MQKTYLTKQIKALIESCGEADFNNSSVVDLQIICITNHYNTLYTCFNKGNAKNKEKQNTKKITIAVCEKEILIVELKIS